MIDTYDDRPLAEYARDAQRKLYKALESLDDDQRHEYAAAVARLATDSRKAADADSDELMVTGLIGPLGPDATDEDRRKCVHKRPPHVPLWVAELEKLRLERERALDEIVAERRTKSGLRKGATVNARMLGLMMRNPVVHGWTAQQWAAELKCAKSTVAETETSKELKLMREKLRAEQRNARRHRRLKVV